MSQSEADILLANQRDSDFDHEREILKKAEDETFWTPFDSLLPLSKTLLHEWVITKVNNSTSTDFESEGPEVARQFCQGLLTLLSNASPQSSPEQNDGIDIALIIMDTIATETPDSLQIFRDYAQEAYLEAKKDKHHNAQILQAKRYLEVEKAKEDAFKTEVQLSGNGKSSANNNINPTAFTFNGDDDGQPPTFAVKNLSNYGHIHDNNMYTNLHELLNLHGATPFQQRKAVRVLCALISKNVSPNHPIHQYVFAFLTSSLPHTNGTGSITLLDGLRALLTNKDLHYIFITHNGIKTLKHILTTQSKQIQPVYFAGYCLWLLSYNQENDIYIEQWGLIETMVSLLRTITRDKVIRVALLTFVNLSQRRDFVTILIGCQFHKILPVLQARKWKDNDIIKDLAVLSTLVSGRLDALSSFDQYIAEIRSGTLKKTPVHCERFWRENASKFDSADPTEEYLRKLVAFLSSTTEEADCLEMAAYDLGEFSRFHPDGKRILTRLGAKLPLMQLMKHPSQDVNKAALLATQKLLIHRWDEMVNQNRQGLRL